MYETFAYPANLVLDVGCSSLIAAPGRPMAASTRISASARSTRRPAAVPSPPKRKRDRVLPPAVPSSRKEKIPDLDKEFKRLKSLQPQIEAETRDRSRRGSGGSSSAAPTSPSRSSSAALTSSPAADPVSSSEVHHSDTEPGHPSEDDLSDDLIDDLSDDHSEAHLSDRGPGQESEPAAAAIAGSSFSSDEMKVNKILFFIPDLKLGRWMLNAWILTSIMLGRAIRALQG